MESSGKNSNSFSTVERVLAAAGVLTMTAGVLAVKFFNPVTVGFFPQCPLYALTGLHCPGCGLTRGFHALFGGDVLTALHFNALLPIYVFVFGYLFLTLFLIAVRGCGLSWRVFPPAAVYGFLILSLVFAVLRNIPVYPLNLLAP